MFSATLTAVVVWLLSSAGVLRPLEGPLYDFYVRLIAAPERLSDKVLLVEIQENDFADVASEESLSRLMADLVDLGAARIILTFFPERASQEFYVAAKENDVVFGCGLMIDDDAPESLSISVPEHISNINIRYGVYHISTEQDAVYRSIASDYHIDGEDHPSLEKAAIPEPLASELLGDRSRYLIRFRGGPGSLPTVDVKHIAAGGLASDLVRDRWVLVGRVAGNLGVGVETPTTAGIRRMSALEFHGHALNTLLTGQVIVKVSPKPALLMLFLAAASGVFLYQWSNIRVSSWLTAALFAGYLGSAFVLLRDVHLWIPVAELCACQGVVFVNSVRHKAMSGAASIRELLLGYSSKLQRKYSFRDLEEAEECWSLVINVVNQTLDLSRVIFLETQAKAAVLREVKALNCSFSDIGEAARDYRKPPYLTAVEENGPIEVSGFLKAQGKEEKQYLVPLLYMNNLMGFWALGVERGKFASWAAFEAVLKDYAALIGELLYQKKESERGRTIGGVIRNYLAFESGISQYRQLSSVLQALERRLRYSEALLGASNAAAIVYDPFGRLQYVNRRMIQLLGEAGLEPHDMTALDLISSLSEYNIARARRILRQVIVEQQRITLPVAIGEGDGTKFMMHLSPLATEGASPSPDNSQELKIRSVLCELVDATGISQFFEMKEKLASRLGLQLRNDLASIDLSASVLQDNRIPPDTRVQVSQMIHEKVLRATEVLVECQQYLGMKAEGESIERFPVDSQEALAAVLRELGEMLAERKISTEVDQPKVMSYVLASRDRLRSLFRATLTILVADALDDSNLTIEVAEEEELAVFNFNNSGFGVPNERFQEYLFGEQSLSTKEFLALREANRWVESWGGELEAYSEVGSGTTITIRLIKFI